MTDFITLGSIALKLDHWYLYLHKKNYIYQQEEFVGFFYGDILNQENINNILPLKEDGYSDIELIIGLYKQFGSQFIHYIEGSYSGLIYNKKTNQVFLFRDFIGRKPLFIVRTLTNYFVSTDLKFDSQIESFEIVPKGFLELKEGQFQIIENHKFENISIVHLKDTLRDSIKQQIPKDEKPFGVFLSGGLDSSIIAHIVAENTNNVNYYILGNDQDLFFARKLAEKIGITNRLTIVELPTQEELPKLVEQVVYCTESYNPSIVSNGLATYLLAQKAIKDKIDVILTGEGADELFCGYSIGSNNASRLEKRKELIANMHFTECRRLDQSTQIHGLIVRCPFLNKKVYSISNKCTGADLIRNKQGKLILRQIFADKLPEEIVQRTKTSFDVGSGIRKLVLEYLTQNGRTEKESLKQIWGRFFQNSLATNYYFYSYPTFDEFIENRGVSHSANIIATIEKILLHEFETIPFQNIFMLNDIHPSDRKLGGTCSDKVLHMQEALKILHIETKLHTAVINNYKCHRMLKVEIDGLLYFIDVGSGWPCIKLLPAFKPIKFTVFGMTFKTEIHNDEVLLFHKSQKDYKLSVRIPLEDSPQIEIQKAIEKRFENKERYPFRSSLRFSKIIGDSFYFLKGQTLKIYTSAGLTIKELNQSEIKDLIENTFKFNLQNLKIWYTPVTEKLNIIAIIATKNRPTLLAQRSLKSVLNQSLLPNQIIIVDDSDSLDVVSRNVAIIDDAKIQYSQLPIQYINNHRSLGAAGSWNSAIDHIITQKNSPQTTYIAILDDDDEWLPSYIELCSRAIQKEELDMLACDFNRITNTSNKINVAPDLLNINDFLVGNPGIQGSNLFLRLTCLLEAGCFDENIQSCTDRDLCIRLADLGYIKYKRLTLPSMNHYAEQDRVRMSTPNTDIKNKGLDNFWMKHSKRMSETQKNSFLKRAKALFNWELQNNTVKDKKTKIINRSSEEKFILFIGIICSSYSTIFPLLKQIEKLHQQLQINGIRLFLFENDLSTVDKTLIIESTGKVETEFITKQMQDKWVSKIEYYKDFCRNNKKYSIAQARTMLQKHIGLSIVDTSTIVWILDEDMQLTNETINGLNYLPQLKKLNIDVLIGKYEYSSPNPPLNGIRVQLVDFWYNLNNLLNQDRSAVAIDHSEENCPLIDKYPDYYYDLSRKHFGHLEHPFWLKPSTKSETVREGLNLLCRNAILIFGGTPLTRPLTTNATENIIASIKDSVNRGGTTFILNPRALTDSPNLNIKIEGTDIRRSDMIWAIINKYYRRMEIKSVNIPIFHQGKAMGEPSTLDIDKVREEILGSCLYAGLTDFLADRPDSQLKFTDADIFTISQAIDLQLQKRLTMLEHTFYRSIGIAKSIKNLKFYELNFDLHKLVETIEKVFSRNNLDQIRRVTASFPYRDLTFILNSMQSRSDKFKKITKL